MPKNAAAQRSETGQCDMIPVRTRTVGPALSQWNVAKQEMPELK